MNMTHLILAVYGKIKSSEELHKRIKPHYEERDIVRKTQSRLRQRINSLIF